MPAWLRPGTLDTERRYAGHQEQHDENDRLKWMYLYRGGPGGL